MRDLLSAAVEHHRAGRHREAEALYRRLLGAEPEHPEALHLLGLLGHETGHHAAGAALIRRAIARDPEKPLYRFNLGVVLAAAGDLAGAEEAYRAALALAPEEADAHNNLGLVLERRGRGAAALACFRAAAAHAPGHAEARANLGRRLLADGAAGEAEGAFRAALALAPELPEARFGLGKSLEEQGRWADAEAAYRAALDVCPDFPEALNNLGAVLLAQGDYARAQQVFWRVAGMRHGDPAATAAALRAAGPDTRAEAPAQTTRFMLRDRIQQLDHLLAEGSIDPSFRDLAELYRAALDELPPGEGPDWRRSLGPEHGRLAGAFLDRVVHYRDQPRLAGPAVNPDLDCASIEDCYLSSATPAVFFDDLLTAEALSGLRRFCRDCTIFFGSDPAGYVSAYLADGFNCSLMYQIAEELKQRLPRVLGPHYLSNMWAYRHVAESAGVTAHTDLAAVTFNFWITPDEANLDPESGGLVVYMKEEPLDWDWLEVNKKKNAPHVQEKIRKFLASAETLVVPYRANRAVMFHSRLFHESDAIAFRDDFADRRINVSLLFGRYGASLGAGAR